MKLNKDQLKLISQILANAGHVFLASMVVPFFVSIDRINPTVLVLGLILSIACWISSILLLKGKRK